MARGTVPTGDVGDEPADGDVRERVLAGDVDAVTNWCLELGPEASRRATDRAATVATCAEVIQHGWWSDRGYSQQHFEAASIVLTTLATEAEMLRRRDLVVPHDLDLAYRLLADRDPGFRVAWADRAATDVNVPGLHVARRLVVESLIPKPTTDAYAIALVAAPGAFDLGGPPVWRLHASVLDVLRANPDLLVDDVWRIFEVEGGGENSLAAHDKYASTDRSWQAALVALSDEGRLDRDRLLDASLDALQRGFAAFRAQWFSAFHEALTPTIEERTARVGRYLALVANPIGGTVSMALKALTQVQQAGGLDPRAVVAEIGPGLLAQAKGTASRAMVLLIKAVGADPTLVADAALVLTTAFGHPASEVQAKALDQLQTWVPHPNHEIVAITRAMQPGCHVSVRAGIDSWLASDTTARAASTAASTEPLASTGTEAVAPVRRFDVTAADWLTPERRLRPLADLNDLFECASAALEGPADPDELEVLLTAIAATGREAVTGDPRAGTLGRRAAKLAVAANLPSQRLVARAIVAWLAPDQLPAADPVIEKEVRRLGTANPSAFLLDHVLPARIEALLVSLVAGDPFVPLAAPTHQGGVLDPVAFVDRVAALRAAPHPAEVLAALLRLAPTPARLREARRALPPTGPMVDVIDAWLDQWADHCTRYNASVATWSTTSHSSGGYTFHDLHLDGLGAITPLPAPTNVRIDATPLHLLSGWFSQDLAGVRWVGSLIPGLPSAWARVGVRAIGPTYGTRDVAHGDPGLLDRYFDPAVPLTSDVHLLLAFALDDPRAAVRPLAVDLAVAAIDDGRLDAVDLGGHIGRLASTGLVTPARWGRSLGDVAEAGPVHRRAIITAIEQALAVAEPRKPQDLLALLELLETLLLEAGAAVSSPAAGSALGRITGASKTARIAARLLARPAGVGTSP